MKTNKHKLGLLKDNSGVSIAFSVFIVIVVVILLAIANLAISPVVQETVNFNNPR